MQDGVGTWLVLLQAVILRHKETQWLLSTMLDLNLSRRTQLSLICLTIAPCREHWEFAAQLQPLGYRATRNTKAGASTVCLG